MSEQEINHQLLQEAIAYKNLLELIIDNDALEDTVSRTSLKIDFKRVSNIIEQALEASK